MAEEEHFHAFQHVVGIMSTTPMPDDGGENPIVEQVRKRSKWDNDDYVCIGLILNGMSDSLFDIYQNVDTSKELWDTLEAKYMAEDASSKKFPCTMKTRVNVNIMIQANPKQETKVNLLNGKPGHLKRDCKAGNVGNKSQWTQAQGIERESFFQPLKRSELDYLALINNIGSAFMSTSKLNDSILWHARLGHVHFNRMQDMSKDGLILAFYMDTEKCQTCMLNKITKKLFQNVKRETKVLELIHSDLCDLHATLSLGNKKYFVTFIDEL
ncbi:zinc finger, CCHC-type containing protein [Tanacetum coccineum]